MKGIRPRTAQVLACVIAAGAVASAGLLQEPLGALRKQYELVVPGSVALQGRPELSLLTIAPGGLRAIIVNYLWITSQKFQQDGRIFDAMQLASLICRFQPRFAAVWGFQAWNMAWNISVTTHTEDERWKWVTNGVKLLRDEAIAFNPRSVTLYKELAWIFFSKMGGTTDVMHRTYKRRLAIQWQELLASPPYGETAEAVEAFRPIAEAPLDKDVHRERGESTIQTDKLRALLKDQQVATYAGLLAAQGVRVDEGLLKAYNRYSRDDSAALYRGRVADDDRASPLFELINGPEHASARGKLLAFVRAQILWNRYKMDPSWMLELMAKYGPLDWRLPEAHALYWATYGIHVCESLELKDIDSLNTDRIVLYCLKGLTHHGRLTLLRNPDAADQVTYIGVSDPRFVETTHQEYIRFGKIMERIEEKPFKDNVLRSGHIGYLTQQIQTLYALGYRQKAYDYFQWLKTEYDLKDGDWALEDLGEFVRARIRGAGVPIPGMALSQISVSLAAAYAALARGDADGFETSRGYALLVYRAFHEGLGGRSGAPPRNRLPAFQQLEFTVVRSLLVLPETFGFGMDVLTRGRLYRQLPQPMQLAIYDWIAPPLEQMCRDNGLDFLKTFPPPPGLKEYRQQQIRQLMPPGA